MIDDRILARMVAQPTEAEFKREKFRLVIRWLILSTLVVFALETVLMVFLEIIFSLSETLIVSLDGIILVMVLTPLNYYFVVLPMSRQVEQHYRTSLELERSNEVFVHAQQALVDSERRFRAVFNQTFQHISLLDPNGVVRLVNQTALDFIGESQEKICDRPIWQLPYWHSSPETEGSLREAVRQASEGKVVCHESQVTSGKGEAATMDITFKPLLDENQKTVLLIYEARDVTQHIRAKEALQRSEEEIMRLYHAETRARKLAETLHNSSLELTRSLNSGAVLETLLDQLHRVVPYSSAHILVFDSEDQLVVRVARGEENWPEGDRLLGKRFETSELELLQPLLAEREMVVIQDTRLHPDCRLVPGGGLVMSWLAVPLLAGSQVIGICLLEHGSCNFFETDLRFWANTLTGQASVAMQNAWLFEQVRDNRERLQALSRRLVEVQESERHYIAQELHDEAGQALASLMVGLRLVERDSDNPEKVAARCRELKQIADGVLENLHRLAIDLRPASLDHLGLVAALRHYTERISEDQSLVVQFQTIGKIERMPGEVETAIYRIVQEALTNVIRHAHATHADILLERRGDQLIVVVEDDGVGFDLQAPKTGQGGRRLPLGMIGIRERADMLGGLVTIESAPGKGTTILLEVPCQFAS